jgi:tetratricopeptide (TPR) repeat protein
MIEFFVGSLSNVIGELLADQFGETLHSWSERRALRRALDEAVARAERQFVAEHSPHDPELVAALTRDTHFADLPSVRAALRAILTQPFHNPSAEIAALRQSFTDVLPTAVDRMRVDAVVQALLGALGREVLYIPQLRELYALSFLKISAESGRANAAHAAETARQMAALNDGFRDLQSSLRQISVGPDPQLLPPPRPAAPERPRPWHNLPQRTYAAFIGRQEELAQLTRLLLPHPRSRHFVVTIDGIGGVGKSALALELAYRCREGYASLPEDERFAAIIWVSAKRTLLTASGIQQRRQTFNTLDDLFREVATVLEQSTILQANSDERRSLVERALAAQRTLLVVDNLETVDDEELLSFLRELPDPTKAIVTTRHRIDIAYAIRITGLPHPDALQLMQVEGEMKGVRLTSIEMDDLERRTGGVPLAIQWSIGLMSLGHSVESVLRRLGSGQSDIARFCFAESVAQIRGRDAYRLLLALALFERSVSRAMLGEVAGLGADPAGRDDGLAELLRLSLVNQKGDRFKLLPLTHAFAQDELARAPDLERELRERWVAFLVTFATAYRVQRWQYRDRRQLMDEGAHLLTLADWCRQHDNQAILQKLTFGLIQYFDLLGQWDKALDTAQAALEIARLIDDTTSVKALLVYPVTWTLRRQRRLAEAERAITEAIELAERTQDTEQQIDALVEYARLLRATDQFERALALCQQALGILPAISDEKRVYLQANIEYELGRIARDLQDWPQARQHFLAVRGLFAQMDDDPVFAAEFAWGLFRQLGIVAERQGDAETASQMYRQCLEAGRVTGMGAHESDALVRIARMEARLGRSESARRYAQEALASGRRFHLQREQAEAEALLAQLGATP